MTQGGDARGDASRWRKQVTQGGDASIPVRLMGPGSIRDPAHQVGNTNSFENVTRCIEKNANSFENETRRIGFVIRRGREVHMSGRKVGLAGPGPYVTWHIRSGIQFP